MYTDEIWILDLVNNNCAYHFILKKKKRKWIVHLYLYLELRSIGSLIRFRSFIISIAVARAIYSVKKQRNFTRDASEMKSALIDTFHVWIFVSFRPSVGESIYQVIQVLWFYMMACFNLLWCIETFSHIFQYFSFQSNLGCCK